MKCSPLDALECIADCLVYLELDLSNYFIKGHIYQVLEVNDDIVHILDVDGFGFSFDCADVSQFFAHTGKQFVLETIH